MIKSLLDHTVTIQRPTNTKDASLGQVITWGDVAGLIGLKCAVYDFKQDQTPEGPANARRDWVGVKVFTFDGNLDIRPGDRIHNTTDSVYYDVIDTNNNSSAGISDEVVFQAFGRLRRVSTSAQ